MIMGSELLAAKDDGPISGGFAVAAFAFVLAGSNVSFRALALGKLSSKDVSTGYIRHVSNT
jgi:hypothetical protein